MDCSRRLHPALCFYDQFLRSTPTGSQERKGAPWQLRCRRHRYDAAGNTSVIIDPRGGRVTTRYDPVSRVASRAAGRGRRGVMVDRGPRMDGRIEAEVPRRFFTRWCNSCCGNVVLRLWRECSVVGHDEFLPALALLIRFLLQLWQFPKPFGREEPPGAGGCRVALELLAKVLPGFVCLGGFLQL